jgi:CheY-like chemotaxis protein
MMGGFMEFESEYGRGSVFTAFLPFVAGDAARLEQKCLFRKVMANEEIPVLVVDDNPVNLTVALGFLAAHNIHADTAPGGAEAITMIQKKHYDLVFMDQMMPDMDGLEATRLIRRLNGCGNLPIVALSANAVTGVEKMFREAGMNDFISKPIEAREMNRVLSTWLPAKKLAMNAVRAEKPEERTAEDPLARGLSRIEGMDAAEALAHVGGNREGLLRALRQFCENCDGYTGKILSCLHARAWNDYAIHVHAVKGILASFGVKLLAERACELEKAAKTADAGICIDKSAALCADITAFREALRGALPGEEEPEARDGGPREEAFPSGPAFVRRQLELLRAACVNGSGDEADTIAAVLERLSRTRADGGSLKEICRLTASYDYEEALEKIDALLPANRTEGEVFPAVLKNQIPA